MIRWKQYEKERFATMTKKELKERVYAEIAPLCKQAHYVQFEYMKDIFAFYRLRDNLLSFILFDNKPGDFECGAYVLPLYMPTESLYLDYGNALRFMDRRHASKYALHTDMTEKEVAAHLQYVYVFLKKRVLPALNRVSTPRGFARHVLRDGFSDILFTSPVNRYTAAAFTWFYLGNTRKGRAYGGKALAEASSIRTGLSPAARRNTASNDGESGSRPRNPDAGLRRFNAEFADDFQVNPTEGIDRCKKARAYRVRDSEPTGKDFESEATKCTQTKEHTEW